MTSYDTIRLLILNNQRSEAERLISMLHASGHPCRAQHVDSEEALVKLLQEQSWDLLIGNMDTTTPTPAIAIKQIRRLNKDVPVILLYEVDEDESPFAVVEGLRLGAADVINLDDDQHLLLVIDRELQNREQRQAREPGRRVQRAFHRDPPSGHRTWATSCWRANWSLVCAARIRPIRTGSPASCDMARRSSAVFSSRPQRRRAAAR